MVLDMLAPIQNSASLALLEDIKANLQGHELNAQERADTLVKISNLRDSVETPLDSILRILSQPMQNAALRVAVELELLSNLTRASIEGQHANGCSLSYLCIAAQPKHRRNGSSSSNGSKCAVADPQLVLRLMRVLRAMGVCDEVGPHIYKANRLTEALAHEGFSSGVKFRYDCEVPTAAKLIPFLESTQYSNPQDSVHSPFEHAFGTPKFDWLAQNPETSANFNSWMTGRRKGNDKESWTDFYPFVRNLINDAKRSRGAVFMIDVGGGRGHDLENVHRKFASIPGKLVLQDQEAVVSCNSLFESTVHDFFTPQPIQGARVYHLRAILHDWPTSECRTILSHIATAMEPGYSKLVIRDFILPDAGAPLVSCCNDMLMMVLLAGMEREESQWKELLEDVGLEIVGFWNAVKGGEGVIEAVKRA